MSKSIVVYKKESVKSGKVNNNTSQNTLEIWKPGLFSFLPPNKDYKYLGYWFFHMFRIFKNRNYSAYLNYHNGVLISSCLVVPSYYKWSFMGSEDVQFTYVMTNKKYRGQGVAGKLIRSAMADLNDIVDSFWYVTDTENPASMRVAEKLGFSCQGKAERWSPLKILKLETAE